MNLFNSSLSPMTTCKLICIPPSFKYRLSLLKCTKYQRVIIYIQSRCRFHFLPQCSSALGQARRLSTNTHHPLFYILMLTIPGVLNTFPHSYMSSLPLPFFLHLLISCHYKFSRGIIGNSNQQTHSFVFPAYILL